MSLKRILLVLWIGACGCALAAPEAVPAGDDPLGGMLIERGHLEPIHGQDLARRVRDSASEVILSAMHFLGVPYRLGGESGATGFDCSGFTRHVFGLAAGLVLPRSAAEQATQAGLRQVRRDQLEPGDLVFFNTLRRTFSHVGIYIGQDKFIHAPRPGAKVRVEDMGDAYWSRRFTGARRAEFVTSSTTQASMN